MLREFKILGAAARKEKPKISRPYPSPSRPNVDVEEKNPSFEPQPTPNRSSKTCSTGCTPPSSHNHADKMNGAAGGEARKSGPMPNFVQVARPYIFEHQIQRCLKDIGVTQAREDNLRLAGVQWIDQVRRAMNLPIRTFNTAVIYYHKFRLTHSDGEYSFVDAAAASLFTACKIEDTLKKSRDILCAAHNLKSSRPEHLSPDDALFDTPSRTIIGLERLMLESSGFDFRNRHPQPLMLKVAKWYGLAQRDPTVRLAWRVSVDLYRTFAPLKQTTSTMAFACLELAGRLLGRDDGRGIWEGRDYERWRTSRGEVMETMLDLLELYTHQRASTSVGADFPIDVFLETRIPLNQELERRRLARYTEEGGARPGGGGGGGLNGTGASAGAGVGTGTGTSNGAAPGTKDDGKAATKAANALRMKVGERGREGTVRFMLNPEREREERAVVAEYKNG